MLWSKYRSSGNEQLTSFNHIPSSCQPYSNKQCNFIIGWLLYDFLDKSFISELSQRSTSGDLYVCLHVDHRASLVSFLNEAVSLLLGVGIFNCVD